MSKRKTLLFFVVLFSNFNFLFSQNFADGECYKIVFDFYDKMFEQINDETSEDTFPEFEEYNSELRQVLKNYTPDKEEIDHCLALAMYFDESNEWVQLFHNMGGDIKKYFTLSFYFYRRIALKNFCYVMEHIDSIVNESSYILYNLYFNYIYDIKIWKKLLEKGLDLNAKDDEGYSVLADLADRLVETNLDFIKLLIDNGYVYDSKNKSGKSLITAARYTNIKEIKDYLESLDIIELWNGFFDNMTYEEVKLKADKMFNATGCDASMNFNTDYKWERNGPCENGYDSKRFATPDKVLAYNPNAKEYHQGSIGSDRGNVEFYFYKNKLSGLRITWDIDFEIILDGAVEKYGDKYEREDTSIGDWPKSVRVAHWYYLDGKEVIVSELYHNYFAVFSTKASVKYHEDKAQAEAEQKRKEELEKAEQKRKEELEKAEKNSKLVF